METCRVAFGGTGPCTAPLHQGMLQLPQRSPAEAPGPFAGHCRHGRALVLPPLPAQLHSTGRPRPLTFYPRSIKSPASFRARWLVWGEH